MPALAEDRYVYLWADGIYLDAGAEEERRVMLTVIGVNTDGEKDLLAIEDAFGESAKSWNALFESLRDRGLKNVAMLVADGAQGVWKAFSAVFPRAKQQRCWIHKMRNIEDKLREQTSILLASPSASHRSNADRSLLVWKRRNRSFWRPHYECRLLLRHLPKRLPPD